MTALTGEVFIVYPVHSKSLNTETENKLITLFGNRTGLQIKYVKHYSDVLGSMVLIRDQRGRHHWSADAEVQAEMLDLGWRMVL